MHLKRSEDMYKVILGGISVYLFMHFFLNAGGVACLIPFYRSSILFISSGGTSLMSIMLTNGVGYKIVFVRLDERRWIVYYENCGGKIWF